MKYSLFYCILLVFRNGLASNSCESSSNSCEECILDPSKCVWCAMANFNGTRCRSEKENLDNWCVDYKINMKSGKRSEGQKLDFNSNTGKVVQIKPQNIKIDLRTGDSFDFEFSVKPAENYPVDLYFLVDASVEMRKVKQTIVDETEAIYYAMQKMTKNVYLGTGSFIDKNIFPFSRTINSTIAYSFRNRLKLTKKIEDFQKTVNETEFGYNHDAQEGTLDALAQVITCENEIGWRNESTKIIIVLTDGPYHCAGDGKWAGIYRPYDGNCYTEDGIYQNELVMDYPSPSIINKLAADREIIIIFVVKEDQQNVYDALSTTIRGSRVTLFKSDSSEFSMNKILEEQYQNIRHQLKLKVNMDPNLRQHFQTSFDPSCNHESPCRIKPGEEKKFRGTITLPKTIEPNNVDIDILAEGIREKLNLNVNIMKKCNCTVETDSVECDSAGTLRCGICECKSERYGHKCKCERKSKPIKPNDNSTCIDPSSPDKICSGFGACDCGKCSCINNDYTGIFCQCHKNMCPLYNDLVCADNGDCKCGTCYCHAGFTGAACECTLAKETCMDGKTECNNRGKCVCGVCQCQELSDWDARHKGDLCKLDCTENACHSHQCQLLEPIALRYLNQEEYEDQHEINMTGVQNLMDQHSGTDSTKYIRANYRLECNNRGKCVCGVCQCQELSDWDARHKGDLCKLDCTENACHSHQCQLLEPIALRYLNQEEYEDQHEINMTGVQNLMDQHSGTDSTKYIRANYRLECNNRGKCVCGVCQCQELSDWDARHKGDLCKLDCTENACHSHQCQLLEPIALRYLNQEEYEDQHEINMTGVQNLMDQHSGIDFTNNKANCLANCWQHCPNLKTGFGCYTAFLYRYSADSSYGIEVKVQTYISCAETYYMYGGICLAILIVSGLIALITWKCITSIRDKREYERFVQEAGVFDSPCDNPIFAPATSTFYNPGFRKRSDRKKSRS